MSRKIPKSSTDLYSVVDLNKKTRRPKDLQCSQHHGYEPVMVKNDTLVLKRFLSAVTPIVAKCIREISQISMLRQREIS